MYDKISSGKYRNTVLFDVEAIPVNEETMTVRQAKDHVEAEKQRKEDQRQRHHAEESRLRSIFKADLEQEYGVSGHPKADKLFDIAWSHGHSSGYGEVANYYGEFAELLQG